MNQSLRPTPHQGIAAIATYVAGKSAPADGFKLSSNENPLGASPRAVEAFLQASATLNRYPDPGVSMLRRAIAKRYQLDANNIVCGHGSDELLHLLAQSYLTPGDEAIFTTHGFLVYKIVTLACGATPVTSPEISLKTDIGNILAKVTSQTKVVFIANPHNPAGSYLTGDELKELHAGLPNNVLLVIDAAYGEYVERGDYTVGSDLVEANDNVVMLRTFSKIHGLAALRLGWGYCSSEVGGVLNKVRGPFNVSAPAIAAGIAAIEDISHELLCYEHTLKWRKLLHNQLTEIGLESLPSVANFILIKFSTPDQASSAQLRLLENGLIVRSMTSYGLGQYLRMSIGVDRANQKFIEVIRQWYNNNI